MRDAFISYSQPDQQCALELVAHLEAQGLTCWMAPRDIAPAADWAEEIIDAIGSARTMVLIFSSSSNASQQVRREVERATHKNVAILPFRIEDVVPSKSLEYFLSSQHWMDAFSGPRPQHYERLCAHLKARLSGQSTGSTGTFPTVPPRSVAPAAPALSAERLGSIEALLAHYVGPVAGHLVKRAARQAHSSEALIAMLAGELDSAAERGEFERRCRALP